MSKRKTTAEFKQEVYDLVGYDYSVLGAYKNTTTSMEFIHNRCGFEWLTTPFSFLHGNYCPVCRKHPRNLAERLAYEVMLKTNNQYYLDFNTSNHVSLNSKIKIVNWSDGKSLIMTVYELRNRLNNGVFNKDIIVNNIRDNSAKKQKQLSWVTLNKVIPPLVFRNNFNREVKGEYTLLSAYTGSSDYIRVRHNVCDKEYSVRADKFMNEHQRCSDCQSHHSIQSYMNELKRVSGNTYTIKYPSEFTGSKSIVTYHCNTCNNDFTQRADMMLQGYGCTYCGQTKGERLLDQVLKNEYNFKSGVDYYYAYVLPNRLHLDFYLPKLHIAIEYDGEQHYKPISFFGGVDSYNKGVERDRKKDKYCKKHGIKLIRIPYTVNTYKDIKQLLSNYIK